MEVRKNSSHYDYRHQFENGVDDVKKLYSREIILNGGTVSGGTLGNVPEISCARFLCRRLKQGGDRTALIDGANGYRLSFEETLKVVKRGSRWFADNIDEGDIVCLCARGRPQYITAILAITAAGGIPFQINWEFTYEELENSLSSLKGVVAILGSTENAAKFAKEKGLQLILFTSDLDTPNEMAEDALSYEEDIIRGWEQETTELEDNWAKLSLHPKEATFQILSSSGTTGLPKKVPTTHYARVANIIQLSDPSQSFYTPGYDTMCFLTPMHTMYSTVLWTHAMYQHVSIVTNHEFKPQLFLSTVQDYKCSTIAINPSVAMLLLDSPITERYDLTSLRRFIKAGMVMSDSIAERLIKKFNLEFFRQAYGMTETGHMMAVPPNMDDFRAIGFLAPGTELQVREIDSDATLGPNQVGEFWVRGPQLMSGYLDMPDVFDENGWLKTGDVGYYNDERCFYYVERIKDVLKVKGHQVAPAELEGVLMNHPLIRDCAVVGKPDLIAGEYPAAFVVRKNKNVEDTVIKEDELAKDIQSFVASHTTRSKHLQGGVRFVDEIPRTSTGKIIRTTLKRWIQFEQL